MLHALHGTEKILGVQIGLHGWMPVSGRKQSRIHRGVTYSGLDSCGVWWSQNDYRAQVGSLGQVTPPTSHNRDKLCTRTESWKVEPFVLGCFTSTYISVSFSLWFGLCAGVIFWLSTLNSFRMPILADRQFQIFSDKYSPLGLWLKY